MKHLILKFALAVTVIVSVGASTKVVAAGSCIDSDQTCYAFVGPDGGVLSKSGVLVYQQNQ